MRRLLTVWAAVLASVGTAVHAQSSSGPSARGDGHVWAAAMERASHNEGFRLRARLTREGGQEPVNLFIAGEKDATHQRLLMRVTSPEAMRGQGLLMSSQAGQPVQVQRLSAAQAALHRADAFEPLPGTGLVPWDFTGLWWQWPQQLRVGEEACAATTCQVLDSVRASSNGVARVRSWHAPALNLTVRWVFMAADGTRLREVKVERHLRRADAGAGSVSGGGGVSSAVARTLLITDASGAVWRLEVYNGEEGVPLPASTFAVAP